MNPYNLERFKAAQDVCYHRVKAELTNGHKRSHWIWFIFPQIAGLGQSGMDAIYAMQSKAEIKAYLNDNLLYGRLNECSQLLLDLGSDDIESIMGRSDDIKLRSSMTMFANIASDPAPFKAILARFYNNQPDPLTLSLLADAE